FGCVLGEHQLLRARPELRPVHPLPLSREEDQRDELADVAVETRRSGPAGRRHPVGKAEMGHVAITLVCTVVWVRGPFGACSGDSRRSAAPLSIAGMCSMITLVAGIVSLPVTQGGGLPGGTVNGQPAIATWSPESTAGALSMSTFVELAAMVAGAACVHCER